MPTAFRALLRSAICTGMLGLGLLAALAPAEAQVAAPENPGVPAPAEPSAAAAVFLAGSLDPRLIPPHRVEGGDGTNQVRLRWPRDPAVGGLLGGLIGCAAGYTLFFLAASREQRGNQAGWGCIIGAVVGMGAGSGWRMPGDP